IDVIIADHQEVFRIGLADVLAAAGELRVVGQAESPVQLLHTLKRTKPHVLILSTNFLPVFPKIKPMLEHRQTALLVLTEENDRIPYCRWLPAQGTVYR